IMNINFLNHKIKWFKLLWLTLTNNDFRFYFKYTIAYAIVNYNDKRGKHASDVLIFQSKYFNKIFKSINS
ncbi:MAG: hypothetical protein ACFFDN_05235, partial [Candidatus Hodarchaeota archaeon]